MKLYLLKRLVLLLAVLLVCIPTSINAAEIFQVRSATVLQVGDQNRSYMVRLSCVKVHDPEAAKNWLKTELPRGTKVNLRPEGMIDGMLLSKVIRLDSSEDVSQGLVMKGFADKTCPS